MKRVLFAVSVVRWGRNTVTARYATPAGVHDAVDNLAADLA